MVFGTPTLDEAHSDCAHLGKLVNGFEAMVNGLGQKLGELLIVEDLERTSGWNLANSAQVESMVVIAVPTLNENGRIGAILGIDLSANVDQVDTFSNVPSRLFDCAVAVDIAELAEAETAGIVTRVGKAVDGHFVCVALKNLTDATIQFVVGNGRPVRRFLVADWCSFAHLSIHWSVQRCV